MQSLKSKTHYIILAALLLGMLFHIEAVYVAYSVAVSVIFAVIIGTTIAFWYVGRENSLFKLKYLEALRKKDDLSGYKYRNVVVKICIAILLFANGYNLTGLMYLTAHGVCYYMLLRSEKALLFRKKVSHFVVPIDSLDKVLNRYAYVVVGNKIRCELTRFVVNGLCGKEAFSAAGYGVCLTEDNAKQLLALLKQDGWLK